MSSKILAALVFGLTWAHAQLEVGQAAPKFYLPRLDGGSFYLSKVVGTKARPADRKPVVVSFFQTTCIPCQAEITEFEKLQVKYPSIDFFLVDISENDALVTEYVEEFDLKLTMLMDRYGVTGGKYGVVDENDITLLPNSYILAADGTVYHHHKGFKPGDEVAYDEKLGELAARQAKELAALESERVAEESAARAKAKAAAPPKLVVGKPAPTFFLPRLAGGSFYLSKVVGKKAKAKERKPVVVSFFQTTCIPCKAEITEFQKLQADFPGIKIYLVDLNEPDDLVTEYVERFDIELEMLMDRYGAVGKKYGVVEPSGLALLPNSFIIAPDGSLYYRHTGFKPGDETTYREKFVELSSP
ncbi:MAG: TlpA family protein disulfide reductase [Candidatus Marinimicrobia bacterium]|nr:TlpA family protein disulfide reductase [Candidatus Neomarinimicrobiota bacterium]